eukprot:5078031-Pleurochrysis_carterae.AAC.2
MSHAVEKIPPLRDMLQAMGGGEWGWVSGRADARLREQGQYIHRCCAREQSRFRAQPGCRLQGVPRQTSRTCVQRCFAFYCGPYALVTLSGPRNSQQQQAQCIRVSVQNHRDI